MKKVLIGLLAIGSFSAFANPETCVELRIDYAPSWNLPADHSDVKICGEITPTSNGFKVDNISPAIHPKRNSIGAPTFSIGTKSNIGKQLCELLTGDRPRKVKVTTEKDFKNTLVMRGDLRGHIRGVSESQWFEGEPKKIANRYIKSVNCIKN